MLAWFLLAQKDASSRRAALQCLSYEFLPVVLQQLLPAVLTAPIHILPLSTLALFCSEEEGSVFRRNVGVYLPVCTMSTGNTTLEFLSFLMMLHFGG